METCVPKAMFSEITKKLASAQDVHFIRDNITQLMESLEAEYATTEAMLKQKREISSWVQDQFTPRADFEQKIDSQQVLIDDVVDNGLRLQE